MTRTEFRRGSDVRERIVDAIVASRVQSDALPSRQQVKRFLRQYFAHVPYEDLHGRDERAMARAALARGYEVLILTNAMRPMMRKTMQKGIGELVSLQKLTVS